MPIVRALVFLLTGLALMGCANKDLTNPMPELGTFALGLNIVVTDNMQMVPISRPATAEEWETALEKAIDDRFGRYDGTKAFNLGIAVDGYALAPPGIPVVASPKSILVITANIWDDAAALKLNETGEQIYVFEDLSPGEVIGSGLTKTREQQLETLAFNAAYAIEQWLLKHPEWFASGDQPADPAEEPVAAAATPEEAAAAPAN